jgi:hypothetical protein
MLDVWWEAGRADDTGRFLKLIVDDIVSLTPGRQPFAASAVSRPAFATTTGWAVWREE